MTDPATHPTFTLRLGTVLSGTLGELQEVRRWMLESTDPTGADGMRYRRKPAEVHAEQLDPADIKGSIARLDGFIAGGMFDFDLDAESDDQLAAVMTSPPEWELLMPGSWVVRWDAGDYTIMDDEEFRRDFEESE